MKKFITLLFILSVAFISQDVQAQKQKKKSKKNGEVAQKIDEDQSRVQFDIETQPQQLDLVRLDTNGVVLVYTLTKDLNVYLNKYDKDLNKIYSTTINIPEKSVISSIKEYKEYIYILVLDYLSYAPGFTQNYKVIQFNMLTKKSTEISGVFEKDRMVNTLIPCEGGVFITSLDCLTPGKMGTRMMLNCLGLGIPSLFGYTKFAYVPYLVSINFKSKKTDEQMLEYFNQAVILGGDLDEEKQELNLSIKNKIKKKENKIYVANFKLTNMGKATKVKETEVDLPELKDFYSAKINTLNAEEKLVFGTYGPETKYLTENASMVANGLYISKVKNGKCAFTTLVRFDEMESFMTNYQKKKMAAGTNSKKAKTYSRGLIFHDIIEDEDQLILTAESYYPTYRTETYYNASTKRYETRRVFDGYQYEKLLIIGFSKDGKKMWEQNINLPFYKTWTPKAMLVRNEIIEAELYFTIALGDGTIKFVKLNKDNTVSTSSGKEEIENLEGEDVLERSFINGGVLYDNNYIVYGYEKVVKEKDGKKTKKDRDAKTVMFINKIAVYPQ